MQVGSFRQQGEFASWWHARSRHRSREMSRDIECGGNPLRALARSGRVAGWSLDLANAPLLDAHKYTDTPSQVRTACFGTCRRTCPGPAASWLRCSPRPASVQRSCLVDAHGLGHLLVPLALECVERIARNHVHMKVEHVLARGSLVVLSHGDAVRAKCLLGRDRCRPDDEEQRGRDRIVERVDRTNVLPGDDETMSAMSPALVAARYHQRQLVLVRDQSTVERTGDIPAEWTTGLHPRSVRAPGPRVAMKRHTLRCVTSFARRTARSSPS